MAMIPFWMPVHKEQLIQSMNDYIANNPEVSENANLVVQSMNTFAERMRKRLSESA